MFSSSSLLLLLTIMGSRYPLVCCRPWEQPLVSHWSLTSLERRPLVGCTLRLHVSLTRNPDMKGIVKFSSSPSYIYSRSTKGNELSDGFLIQINNRLKYYLRTNLIENVFLCIMCTAYFSDNSVFTFLGNGWLYWQT